MVDSVDVVPIQRPKLGGSRCLSSGFFDVARAGFAASVCLTIVNSSIFTGILTMVLLANLAVERVGLRRPRPWFGFLLASVVLLWAFDLAVLNHYPLLVRGVLGGLLNALPIGFAGIIVSILLVRSSNPTASLGSNLLGAVIGGCLEYLSIYLGLKAIVLIALALYVTALLLLPRRLRGRGAEAVRHTVEERELAGVP